MENRDDNRPWGRQRYLLVVVNWRYCRNHWYDFRLEQRACSKEKPMSFIGRLLRGLPTWQPANKNLSTLTDAFHSKINKQTNLGVSALADYGNSFDSSLFWVLGPVFVKPNRYFAGICPCAASTFL